MDKYIEQFIYIRNSLYHKLEDLSDVLLNACLDPISKYVVIKETQNLLKRELVNENPDFPERLLPNVKIKIFEEEYTLEIGIQQYLNTDSSLNFLANIEHESNVYDLYCRKSMDPAVSHVYYAKYGHTENMFDKASKTAEAQYMLGIVTPLSTAYAFALDEGYVVKKEDD